MHSRTPGSGCWLHGTPRRGSRHRLTTLAFLSGALGDRRFLKTLGACSEMNRQYILFVTSLSLLTVVISFCVQSGHNAKRSFKVREQGKDSEIIYGGLQHCGILVRDAEKSRRFFMDVFDFKDDTHLRPTTLPFKGAFLKFGRDQIHLMELPNPDPIDDRPEHGGRDRHIALTINNIDTIKQRLDARGMKYTTSQSGRRALFCRDLDGNAFELVEDTNL